MKKFYVGTDIGTNSVGVACTDENYKLLRAKGKDCWTVRLFEEAKTAAERRTFRTARRRLARRRQRIVWLQDLFAPYIEDKTFFIRLNNSQFLSEDKDELLGGNKNNLFAGEYDDRKYHEEFPTVFHLREALITGGKYDLRLYYLALHHIIKYRGHFLFEGSVEEIRDFSRLLKGLNGVLSDLYGDEISAFSETASDEVKAILLDKTKGIKDKQLLLEKLFAVSDKTSKEIIKGIIGAKISPAVLFGEEYKELKNFSFKETSDDTFEQMRMDYGNNFALFEAMRSIYSYVTFEKLLEGHRDISSAMIAVYDKHNSDLNKLKNFIRTEAKEYYNQIFRNVNEKSNYVNYIGHTIKDGVKKKVKRCKDEEFFAYLKKILSSLNNVNDEACRNAILAELENGTFLPKILHSDNGLFPRQINEAELNRIVTNMVKNYPETAAFADKILPLFRFRIPYYVGPLTGINSWAVRTSEKVTPWNIEQVVDFAKSNEEFMRRMTNKCTYLRGEDVLPKASVLYQKFDVLNQINKLRVNDMLLPIALKQKIYNELFLVYPRVSDKKIKELLVRENYISAEDAKAIVLKGKDGEFKASMSTYIRLKKILGNFVDKDIESGGGVCENIVLWHTLNTDKKIVENLIRKNYGNIPEIKAAISQLKGLTFNDFGKLSAKFLNGITSINKTTGEIVTILDVLFDTNENLNEILNDEKYNFAEVIESENGLADSKVDYSSVEELYVSPAVRRGIWQTLGIIDEYVAAIGKTPDKIFVEVTREDGQKGDEGRTQPRKRQLLEKYKYISEAYADVIAQLNDEKYSDLKLRQERLFLYFRQLGRCMYSGERIDLENLNTDTYDVDHILPRTYIKDDSLDNKVLVLRSKNAKKSDTYPLPEEFFNQRGFWKMLLEKNLISRTTYDRLTRTDPLGDNDYKDFINRQKVITDQTAKAVIELLGRKYPNTKIVFSKAKNVNDFKNKFNLFKCRETNDLHHARDAYLNVVVGNVYDTVFSTPIAMFRQDGDAWRTYNLKKLFTRDVAGAWSDDIRKIVLDTFAKHSMMVTRYATCNKGMFYDQTVYEKGDSCITAPRKGAGPLADYSKYGGYSSQKTAYFAIVSSIGKKGERIKTIEAIPVLVDYRSKADPDAIIKYLKTKLNQPEIIIEKIKTKQLVSYNGTLCYLAGVDDPRIFVHNANQLFTENKTDEYVCALLKLLDMDSKNMVAHDETEYVIKTNRNGERKLVITKESNIELYDELRSKLGNTIYSGISAFKTFKENLDDGIEKFVKLSIIDQSKVIIQVLKVFKNNAETANITLIGGGSIVGKTRFSKNITDVDFKIIDLSPAGLTQRIRKV